MKKTTAFLVSLLLSMILLSQTPGMKWQRTIGGSEREELMFNVKTIDNGIILIGTTHSNDKGFTGHGNNTDIWVEKLNLDGVTQWRKTYGGSDNENVSSYWYNTDGTLVIASTSASVDGDVTDHHGTDGSRDIWVIKLDVNGNLLWKKSFGGSEGEESGRLIRTNDGNYVVTGVCSSLDGDVTGYHGGDGEQDTWVIKFNESGTLLWQKALGGTGFEENYESGPPVNAPDGSLYILCNTDSEDGDVSGLHGWGFGSPQTDIWLVKLDASGNLIWQKCLGGKFADWDATVRLTSSGEIYLLGHTGSRELPSFHGTDSLNADLYFCRISSAGNLLFEKCIGSTSLESGGDILSIDNTGKPLFFGSVQGGDGDVVGYHGGTGADIWIFKTDMNGNIEWQRVLGGTGEDFVAGIREDHTWPVGSDHVALGSVVITNDGGYFITAYTESKDGDITGFHDGPPDPAWETLTDLWVVKLTASGQIEYTRSLGGSKFDFPAPALEIGPNDYIITGVTDSQDGDVQTNNGKWDGWVVRFTSVNRIKGTVFIDLNGNGIKDAEDSLFSNVVIKATKGSDTRSAIPYNGNFVIETDTGSYTTTLTLHQPYYTITPASHTSSFSTYFNTDSFSFALHPISGSKDLVINAIPLIVARPGFNVNYVINYKNVGVESIPSGEILFVKDPRLTLLNAVPVINSSNGDTLKWNYTNLDPQNQGMINLQFQIAAPPAANNGDTLSSLAIITPVAGDLTPHDDTSYLRQRLQGSFDPNDKAENVGGSITLERVQQGEYLSYFIRFQNTGTDTAFNVTVRDTLDTDLDWNTFEMIASSHAYQMQLIAPNILEWKFYDIRLPDSNVNEPASHGYIAYRIKPVTGAQVGTTLLNRASIYFDFNLPVATNFAATIVGMPIALPLHLLEFKANYQEPFTMLQWSTADESNVDKFIIERGTDPMQFTPVGTIEAKGGTGITPYQFKDHLANISGDRFYYRLKMIDIDHKFTYSNIERVMREGKTMNELLVSPNPVSGKTAFAWIDFEKAAIIELGVFDMQGRYRILDKQAISKGFNLIPLDLSALTNGIYILQAKMADKLLTTRFVLNK
jgi:uncharacterized repeat protein (TIGR01451 family)